MSHSRLTEVREAIGVLRTKLVPLLRTPTDSIMLTGSEAYQAALVFYNNVRTAKKVNVGSAAAVYDDLSTRFPGAPAKKV